MAPPAEAVYCTLVRVLLPRDRVELPAASVRVARQSRRPACPRRPQVVACFREPEIAARGCGERCGGPLVSRSPQRGHRHESRPAIRNIWIVSRRAVHEQRFCAGATAGAGARNSKGSSRRPVRQANGSTAARSDGSPGSAAAAVVAADHFAEASTLSIASLNAAYGCAPRMTRTALTSELFGSVSPT